MKKMLVVLAIAGMFLASCSKEELNKLQAEKNSISAEKAALETKMNSLIQEKEAAVAQLAAVQAEKDRAVFVLDSIKTKYKIKM